MVRKLTFDEALGRINEELPVSAADVQARALQRFVWVAEWHMPGCLSESRSYVTTKRDAIESALGMASGTDGPPRGMRTDLERSGRSDRTPPDGWAQMAITTVERVTLSQLL